MTVEASLRVIEALGGWANWASQQPPPGPADRPQTTTR